MYSFIKLKTFYNFMIHKSLQDFFILQYVESEKYILVALDVLNWQVNDHKFQLKYLDFLWPVLS